MIVFMPSWGQLQNSNFVEDDLIGPIRSFLTSPESYIVMVTEYLPQLRYFLHNQGLYESNVLNLYDEIQGFTKISQRKVKINDLNFPFNSSYMYFPTYILVYSSDLLIAKILFGQGSQISEVIHFSNENITLREIFDDRGYLSSRKKFEEGTIVYTEYLDKSGEWIIRVCEKTKVCYVNQNKKGMFRKLVYSNIEELICDFFKEKIQKDYSKAKFLVSLTDNNFKHVYELKNIVNINISIFKDRINPKKHSNEQFYNLLSSSNSIVVDDTTKKINHSLLKKDVHQVPPYDTRFEFSRTQEFQEEIIYVDSRGISVGTSNILLKVIMDFIEEEKNNRLFKIVWRVINEANKKLLMNEFSNYPEEKVSGGKGNEFCFKTISNEQEIFEIMDSARLIIDPSPNPDLFTQIAGISSGIPQINCVKTQYVEDGKNGKIITNLSELSQILRLYLNELKEWQKARTFCIRLIKENSEYALKNKIITLLGEEDFYGDVRNN